MEANSGEYRSERFYYDGHRRIAEVVVDPVSSIATAISNGDAEALGIEHIQGALTGIGEDGKKMVPLWFEGLQLEPGTLAEPPAAYISREYIWGLGDRGPDELLTMFAWDGQYTLNGDDARPTNQLWSVLTDSSGDCVALVTEATVSEDARVAWQGTYEPYGTVIESRSIVVHPHLKAGHKGLFAERLDGGVVTGLLGVDRGRLEPGATLLYHNRNRSYLPMLGRFLQSDPNASGLAVIGSVSHSGMRAMTDVMAADLSAVTSDGVGLYGYLRSNPIRGTDPTGLYGVEDWRHDIEEGWEIFRDKIRPVTSALGTILAATDGAGLLSSMVEELVGQYSANIEDDVDWAMDWSRPDKDSSRQSDQWVTIALLGGVSNHFGVSELADAYAARPSASLAAGASSSWTSIVSRNSMMAGKALKSLTRAVSRFPTRLLPHGVVLDKGAMGHILSGHHKRFECRPLRSVTTYFPSDWSVSDVASAIHGAVMSNSAKVREALRHGRQFGIVGNNNGKRIQVWIDKAGKVITAYPIE